MQIKRIIKRGRQNSRVALLDGSSILVENSQLEINPKMTDINLPPHEAVKEKFSRLEKMVTMVAKNHSPSLIVCGDAGIGKTHTTRKQLGLQGLTEITTEATTDEKAKGTKKVPVKPGSNSFIYVKGYTSPMGLYSVLHNYRTSLIVFDDCDAVFKNEVSINILKSALDSYDKRVVSWFSPKCTDLGYEQQFEFSGRVIFLSNLQEEKLDDAVKSRSFVMSVRLTRAELGAHMFSILDSVEPSVQREVKMEVLNYMGTNLHVS